MFTCFYTPTNKDWGYKGITSICLSVHTDFVSRHTGISVYKNAYITGMFCSDAGPDTILVKGFVTRLTRPVPLVELELLTLPERLSSPQIFRDVRVTRSLVLCVCFLDIYLSFCSFSFDHCVGVFPFRRLPNNKFLTRFIRRVPLVDRQLLTIPEHLSSPRFLVGMVLLDL